MPTKIDLIRAIINGRKRTGRERRAEPNTSEANFSPDVEVERLRMAHAGRTRTTDTKPDPRVTISPDTAENSKPSLPRSGIN